VQNNPVNAIDPDGRFAFILPAIPPAVVALIKAVAFVGSAVLAADLIAKTWIDDPDANKEWQDYKDRYREPPPPGLDECTLLRWKLAREKQLLKDRTDWDAKWCPGRHDEAIKQTKNAIRNLEKKIRRKCGGP
jgi:hypothetical protein